ncbi:MAG: hypothetical protein H0W25_19535 [Acidimicrobiia bacterium]|nr:hypothetical protein [Acidimicrobiia bacterium]
MGDPPARRLAYAAAARSLAGGDPRLTGWNDIFLVGQAVRDGRAAG